MNRQTSCPTSGKPTGTYISGGDKYNQTSYNGGVSWSPTKTARKYVDSNPGQCEWSCGTGFIRQGNTCRELTRVLKESEIRENQEKETWDNTCVAGNFYFPTSSSRNETNSALSSLDSWYGSYVSGGVPFEYGAMYMRPLKPTFLPTSLGEKANELMIEQVIFVVDRCDPGASASWRGTDDSTIWWEAVLK